MGENRSHRWALLHLGAVAAGRQAFLQCTLPDGAEAVAVNGFLPVHTATLAVDVFGQNGGVVQLGPEFRGLLTQGLVVVLRCNIGVALLAVQTTDGNQFIHFFHRFSIGKIVHGRWFSIRLQS